MKWSVKKAVGAENPPFYIGSGREHKSLKDAKNFPSRDSSDHPGLLGPVLPPPSLISLSPLDFIPQWAGWESAEGKSN